MHKLKIARPLGSDQKTGWPKTTESVLCTVRSVFADYCVIDAPGTTDGVRAVAAMHLPLLQPGCRVLAFHDPVADEWLVHAAFAAIAAGNPGALQDTVPAVMQFDAETRTLRLDASRLQLNALDSIELSCGTARLKITLQGAIRIMADSITSSAVGSHRIEGASIDLN